MKIGCNFGDMPEVPLEDYDEERGEHAYKGCFWSMVLALATFLIVSVILLTSCTTTYLLWYKVRLVVLSSTHGRILLRAVSARGCCAHSSIAWHVSFAELKPKNIVIQLLILNNGLHLLYNNRTACKFGR
jgi:hypothetical protein